MKKVIKSIWSLKLVKKIIEQRSLYSKLGPETKKYLIWLIMENLSSVEDRKNLLSLSLLCFLETKPYYCLEIIEAMQLLQGHYNTKLEIFDWI